MNESSLRLQRLADAAGIERSYWDALGTHRELDEETACAVLRAMGISLDDQPAIEPIVEEAKAPLESAQRCFISDDLAEGSRRWGLSVQLYALRSSRNWGIGDFTDLAALARVAAEAGASLIGLNPLHARHLSRPDAASPYWPSSRRFLDVLYIDIEAVEDFGACGEVVAMVRDVEFQSRLRRVRDDPLVDHVAVTAIKLRALRLLHRHFRDHRSSQQRAAFEAFVLRHGEALQRFAEFEALRLGRPFDRESTQSWHQWPDAWRDPASATLGTFRIEAADDIDFQLYLQWQAEVQLDRAAAAARDAGLSLSLYRDLAVGAADDSAEVWGDQPLIAFGVSIGAPPDLFSRDGQNWGLPPFNPRILAAQNYRPFAELIAANMRGAGAIRIDHVMALSRLFWIPAGMPGTRGCYVRSDFDALATVVADESVRHRCMVIGEDLGSVPDGLRERLSDRGFLSYRVLIFERWWSGDGSFKRPWDYPKQSLAMVATHDMPTIADFWAGSDIDRRDRLGLYADPAFRDDERRRRDAEREGIRRLLRELNLDPGDDAHPMRMADALHAVIARTPSLLAVVQLDDVLGEVEPTNIPGTTNEYPNWRRKVSVAIEDLAADGRLQRTAQIMRDAGRS